ncbi:unnamed protein product [Arabidopsis thaliana]|uniref:Exocyst subunit Exo70 family protein n=1 Tax=Arabidopsis thaliana TaxID=3702 RepID=Q9FHC6_ARATH|nr:unnamed protein product [Arabidopsis thaliana]
MGVAQAMEALTERASLMKESLHKSQTITDNMVGILGSFDHRLSALETAMRPTQVVEFEIYLLLKLKCDSGFGDKMIRTHSIRRAHENIDKALKAAEVILDQFDISRKAEAKILRGPHEDLESYLEAIDQLRGTIKFFSNNKMFKSASGVISHAHGLLSKALSKLEDEFRQILQNYSKPMEPDRLFECLPSNLRPSSEGEGGGGKTHDPHHKSLENAIFTVPTVIPPRVLPLLHDLAQQMVQAGHQQQLFKSYRDTRAAVLEQSLRKLGVERLSKDDVQRMQWEVLEAKIGNWIHYMRISVKLLFAAEKKICDQILDGVESLRDQCFGEVTVNSVAVLLSFGEAIAKSKRSPEKLFVLLDMYEIMRELQPEIELLFGSKPCAEMKESALNLTKRLAQTAQETFADFEEAVEKDATKTAVMDGTVHPLTSYVINYVKFLFDYQTTLRLLFQEFDSKDPDSELGAVTTRIMHALQNNLDEPEKPKHNPELELHFSQILQCLTVQSSGSGPIENSNISRASVKDRFKTFNSQFEELHQRQCQWTVPDSELRESLRLAVAEVLLPAFRSFLKRFGPMIESGKNPQKYIRFSPEDLERMLNEFFEGKTWSEPKR